MNTQLYNLMKAYIKNNSEVAYINKSDIDFKTTNNIIEYLFKNKNNIHKNIQDLTKLDMGYMVKISWLNNFSETTKEVGYIMSYKEAGDILVEHSMDVMADYMFYSVMFNYMQYLELALKNILSYSNSKIPYTHDIIALWETTKPVLKNNFGKDEIEILILDSIIKAIFIKNNTSMDFRYKADKQGNDNILNSFTLDLYVVKIWIDVFDTIIYDIYNA